MYSETNINNIYVFDFDGVICDSSLECLIVSWNAWQKYFKLNKTRFNKDSFDGDEIDYFFPLRPEVKGSGEYFPLWKNFYESKGDPDNLNLSDINSSSDKVISCYKELFYECRNDLKRNDLAYWLDLHEVYDDIISILKGIHSSKKLYIATLKDKESVLSMLSNNGIELQEKNIFDQSVIESKVEALEMICELEGQSPCNLFFFDDNANHLLEPKNNGYNCFLASWGVKVPSFIEIAKKNSIDIIYSSEEVLYLLNT